MGPTTLLSKFSTHLLPPADFYTPSAVDKQVFYTILDAMRPTLLHACTSESLYWANATLMCSYLPENQLQWTMDENVKSIFVNTAYLCLYIFVPSFLTIIFTRVLIIIGFLNTNIALC